MRGLLSTVTLSRMSCECGAALRKDIAPDGNIIFFMCCSGPKASALNS
jgi:hypothetical protein